MGYLNFIKTEDGVKEALSVEFKQVCVVIFKKNSQSFGFHLNMG